MSILGIHAAGRTFLAVALLILFAVPSPPTAAASEVVVGGTGGVLALLDELGRNFNAEAPAIRVRVLPSLGSHGGLRALREGAVDIAPIALPLTPEDRRRGLTDRPLCESPFGFFTSRPNGGRLSTAQVIDVYTGRNARWPDGATARAILRLPTDSDTALSSRLIPGMAAALNAAAARRGVPVAITDQHALTLAERIPGSLLAATLVTVLGERRALRPVDVDGVALGSETMRDDAYPLIKRFRLALRNDATPDARAFADFVESPRSAEIARALGCRAPSNGPER